MAACYRGVFRCQCDRMRRLIANRPRLLKKYGDSRKWHWRADNGCDGPTPKDQPVHRWNNRDLLRCAPRVLEDEMPEAWEYLRLWVQWEKGRALTTVAVLDEPARLIDAMHCIGDMITQIDQEKRERGEGTAPKGWIGSPNAPRPSTGPLSGRGRRR